MDRRRLWRWVRLGWVTLGITLTVAFVAWSLVAYRAAPEGRAATGSDAAVDVRHGEGYWSFSPAVRAAAARPGLVFFPGALVDPVAYAPLARAAAVAGFPAFIVELPRRGTMGGADDSELDERLDRALAVRGASRPWIAAGHSRGAVVAARIASEHRRGLAGLVLIGTTHPRDVDLSALREPVTKVVGTRDGLARAGAVEANRAKLPASTRWVWIDGGNHSQFGWYGFQPGDRRATIAASAQREVMTREVIAMLARVDSSAVAGASGRAGIRAP
ncbi:MAG TPA: alpha/beta family hydrolase [Gemmatimonadaceae bacterium]|nr:alpha/beta family hydrolase [Gemmatimonadaceae bacterium]